MLLFTTFTFSQTTIQGNLIVDGDITIGQNCGNGNGVETITYTGDLNFNGNYIISLKGVNLIINGNINGTGTINNICNNTQSSICYNGVNNSGNNITYNNVVLIQCNLNLPEFDLNKDEDYFYDVYNTLQQKIYSGVTHKHMLEELPKKEILFIKIEGFKIIKTYIY